MADYLFEVLNDKTIEIKLSREIYLKEAVIEASYNYCNDFFVRFDCDDKNIIVYFERKDKNNCTYAEKVKKFINDIIDQQIRLELYNRTLKIRESIYQKAFSPLNKGEI